MTSDLRTPRTTLCLAAALSAAACARDTAGDLRVYRDAVDELQARYAAAPPWAPPPAAPDGSLEALAAARARGALTLDDCFAAAVDVSEHLAIAGESYLQQRFARDEAFARLLPSLEARVTEFYQDPVRLPGASATGRFFTLTEERRQVAVALTQPLFQGLREFASLRQRERLSEARRQDLGTALRGLYLDVARAFYGTLGAEAEARILEDTVRLEEERLREMEARREQGLARRTETLLVEAQLEADRARLSRARSTREQLRLQLGFLLGRPTDLPLRDALPERPVPRDPGPLLEEALQSRSDLLARDAEAQAAAEQPGIVLGEYAGSLELTGSYYPYRTGYSEFQKAVDYDLLLTYTLPLFEGGGTKARYAAALSLQRQAAQARDALRRQIDVEVRGAHLEWLSAEALLANLEAGLRSSEENHRLIQEEYRQGIAATLDVHTASNLLTAARLDLDRQRLERKLAWVRLRVAQGLLPERSGAGSR